MPFNRNRTFLCRRSPDSRFRGKGDTFLLRKLKITQDAVALESHGSTHDNLWIAWQHARSFQ